MPGRTTLSSPVRRRTLSIGAATASTPLVSKYTAFWNLVELSGSRPNELGDPPLLEARGTVNAAQGVGSGQFAADFVGTSISDPYLTCSSVDVLQPGTGPWALTFWVYCNDLASTRQPVTKGSPELSAGGFNVQVLTTGAVRFNARRADDTGAAQVDSALGLVTAASWHLIEVGMSPTDGLFVGVDGGAPVFATTDGVFGNTSALTIGFANGSGTEFPGRVMTLGTANLLLTPGDRAKLYNDGTAALLYGDL